ncbi:hypothetical protein HPP92_027983 [Vanilla planifolia]|uniref:Uncharacterized protein n=1 Tax=Vanilla planifolia TaxID=51239 RepID=A0A835U6Q6_VANPL|nr:hypothetical protein HPP92_027983 [Vanilla planifolia]
MTVLFVETIPPKTGDLKFKKWKIKNNVVMSWLDNSMTNENDENFLLYNINHEIYDAIGEFYSKRIISPRFLRLKLISMIFDREILPSPNSTTSSLGKGNNCSKNINGTI